MTTMIDQTELTGFTGNVRYLGFAVLTPAGWKVGRRGALLRDVEGMDSEGEARAFLRQLGATRIEDSRAARAEEPNRLAG